MRHFSRFRAVITGFLPVLLIGGFAVFGWLTENVEVSTGEKTFTLEEIQVTANLRRDGVLQVREEVTYDFDGTFNVGSRTFDPGPWEIRDIRAFEDGERLEEVTNNQVLFEWDISPASGEHTYELRYEVHDAVVAWPDVVELNWQWVGRDVPNPVGHHEVDLRLPGDGEGVRAWAHGPLSGTIDVGDARVHTEIDDLPEFTFLETRVIAPRGRFTRNLPPGRVEQDSLSDGCDVILDVIYQNNPGISEEEALRLLRQTALESCRPSAVADIETEPQADRIIAEETALAEEANREREAFLREQERKEDRKRALQLAAPFVVLGGALLAWLIWRRWGREPEPTTEVEYWREVPDDAPAVAQALLEWGYVDTDAFSATVVDLAQRGYLTIEERGSDHVFTATGKSRDGLLEFERMAMTRLFEDGNETSQKQLTNWAKAHRASAASWLSSFTQAVVKGYEAKGYQVKGQVAAYLLYLLVVAAVAFFGVIAWFNDAAVAGAAVVGAAVVLLVGIVLLKRRTPVGAQRHAEWEGLKRFLKDFSQLQDAPSGHMALYERYLVAAVALGVSDELIEALKVRIPEVANDPTFATWYVGSRTGGIGGFSSLGDFSSGFSSATASSFRPPPSSRSSSGGGGGGGFSGGGGGGGGGGGFGAR